MSLLRGFRAFNVVRRAQKNGVHLSLSAGYKPGSIIGQPAGAPGSRAVAGTGALVGVGASAGNDALGGLLAVAVIFIYGDLLAALFVVCLKYAPREFPAVPALEKWKTEHPEWIDDRQ